MRDGLWLSALAVVLAAAGAIGAALTGSLRSTIDQSATKISGNIQQLSSSVAKTDQRVSAFDKKLEGFKAISAIDEKLEELSKIDGKIDRLIVRSALLSPADAGHSRVDARVFMINSQIRQAEDSVVLVGDSITEAALLPSSVCGHSLVNAGVGGATPTSYLEFIKRNGLLADLHAALVIVALGTNNAQTVVPLSEFAPSYHALLTALSPKARSMILAGIPQISGPSALSAYFDRSRIAQINDAIHATAVEHDYTFIPIADHAIETMDGVHPSAAGYETWRHTLVSAMKKRLGCEPTASAN